MFVQLGALGVEEGSSRAFLGFIVGDIGIETYFISDLGCDARVEYRLPAPHYRVRLAKEANWDGLYDLQMHDERVSVVSHWPYDVYVLGWLECSFVSYRNLIGIFITFLGTSPLCILVMHALFILYLPTWFGAKAKRTSWLWLGCILDLAGLAVKWAILRNW